MGAPHPPMPTREVGSKDPFPTLMEIKSKLPSECFRAELGTSMYYVARSAVIVALLGASAYGLLSPSSSFFVESVYIRVALWTAYWYLQGVVFWGIFVLGHDCGHSSFILLFWFRMSPGEPLTAFITKTLAILTRTRSS